jgi:hypothetical protein
MLSGKSQDAALEFLAGSYEAATRILRDGRKSLPRSMLRVLQERVLRKMP